MLTISLDHKCFHDPPQYDEITLINFGYKTVSCVVILDVQYIQFCSTQTLVSKFKVCFSRNLTTRHYLPVTRYFRLSCPLPTV